MQSVECDILCRGVKMRRRLGEFKIEALSYVIIG